MTHARWKIRASPPRIDPAAPHFVVVQVGDFVVPWSFEATAIRDDDDASDWPPIRMHIAMDGSRPVVRKLTIGTEPFMETRIDGVRTKNWTGRASEDTLLDYRLGHEREPGVEPAAVPTRAVNPSLLRELPLARLAKHAMLGVAYRFGDGPVAEKVVHDELRDDAGFYRLGHDETELDDSYGVYIFDEPAWDEHWTEYMQVLAGEAEQQRIATRRNRITDERLAQVAEVYREAIEHDRPPKKSVAAALNVAVSTAGRYIVLARKKGHLGPTEPGKKGELAR
jgi:hypothetical protein